jgi:FKBP-type peptidyl-prolyl cis-trans isomerase (trigger factor)
MAAKQSKSKKSAQDKKTAEKPSSKAVLARLDDGTIQITLSIPLDRVQATQEEVIKEFVENIELPGFRKGKAPLDLAAKRLDRQKIYEHTLQHLLPEFYADAVQEHNLKPVLAPRFELVSVDEDKDWVVRAVTCELPLIDLGDYKKSVKEKLKTSDIWVPGKDKSEKTELTREDKEQQVIKALVESVSFEMPSPLVEEEVNHKLSQLLDQVQRLGLTVEQYLASTGRTIEALKEEYAQQAQDSIKVVLLLNAVSDTEKLTVSDTEVQEVVDASLASVGNDAQARAQVESPDQKRMIYSVLMRRKALDVLVDLI